MQRFAYSMQARRILSSGFLLIGYISTLSENPLMIRNNIVWQNHQPFHSLLLTKNRGRTGYTSRTHAAPETPQLLSKNSVFIDTRSIKWKDCKPRGQAARMIGVGQQRIEPTKTSHSRRVWTLAKNFLWLLYISLISTINNAETACATVTAITQLGWNNRQNRNLITSVFFVSMPFSVRLQLLKSVY